MRKVAIFVEGQTEQIFTATLVRKIADAAHLDIQFAYQEKNGLIYEGGARNPNVTHFVLLVDCRGDAQVKSQILDNYASLQNAGYQAVIGLRDVYPELQSAVSQIEAALLLGLPTGKIPIHMHLAIMEVESWFLAEVTHLPRIHKKLTADLAKANGVDLHAVPPQQWVHPAEVLDTIYKLVGCRYTKKRKNVQRTIDALSLDALLGTEMQAVLPEFSRYVSSVKTALSV